MLRLFDLQSDQEDTLFTPDGKWEGHRWNPRKAVRIKKEIYKMIIGQIKQSGHF